MLARPHSPDRHGSRSRSTRRGPVAARTGDPGSVPRGLQRGSRDFQRFGTRIAANNAEEMTYEGPITAAMLCASATPEHALLVLRENGIGTANESNSLKLAHRIFVPPVEPKARSSSGPGLLGLTTSRPTCLRKAARPGGRWPPGGVQLMPGWRGTEEADRAPSC